MLKINWVKQRVRAPSGSCTGGVIPSAAPSTTAAAPFTTPEAPSTTPSTTLSTAPSTTPKAPSTTPAAPSTTPKALSTTPSTTPSTTKPTTVSTTTSKCSIQGVPTQVIAFACDVITQACLAFVHPDTITVTTVGKGTTNTGTVTPVCPVTTTRSATRSTTPSTTSSTTSSTTAATTPIAQPTCSAQPNAPIVGHEACSDYSVRDPIGYQCYGIISQCQCQNLCDNDPNCITTNFNSDSQTCYYYDDCCPY